jgi:glycosyltransferase involved in cell wall biosynthesis
MERGSFYCHALPWLLEQQFDAIIVNKPFDFPYLWWAKQKGLKSKIVFRSGGREFFMADRFFARVVDVWASTSRYNAAQVEGHYHQTVNVIHNGVDTDHFTFQALARDAVRQEWQAQWGLPHEAVVIGSVGRLVGWKGLRVILESLATLPAHVHYVICGEGEAQADLQAHAQALGVAARVHFAGRIPHHALPQVLSAFDCFVQPSIGEESFGISVVEAMACQCPVLVSENGGLTEIVNSATVGSVLPRGDTTAWSAALANIVDNSDWRKALGLAARERVLQHFTWMSNAAKLVGLIEKVPA